MPKKTVLEGASKGESLTLRLTAKMRYGLELLARKQHRSLSSVAEWMIDRALHDEKEGLWGPAVKPNGDGMYDKYLLEDLWAVTEAERLVNLALKAPQWLNYEEELVWNVISKTDAFWCGYYLANGIYAISVDKPSLDLKLVEDCWETIKKVAKGDLDASALPDASDFPTETSDGKYIPPRVALRNLISS